MPSKKRKTKKFVYQIKLQVSYLLKAIIKEIYDVDGQRAHHLALSLVDNGAVKIFIDKVLTELVKRHNSLYTKTKKTFLISRIDSYSIFTDFSDKFSLRLINLKKLEIQFDSINYDNVAIDISSEEIHKFFDDFFNEYYGTEDSRKQIEDRPIRRLDSLARIFSLPNQLSVCSAVAFHHNKLIISANVSKQGKQENIKNILADRAIKLHQLITKLNMLYTQNDDGFKGELKSLSQCFVRYIFSNGKTSMPKDRIQQDVEKFVTAIICDVSIFTPSERQLWLLETLSYNILLPNQLSSRQFELQSHQALLDFTINLPASKSIQAHVKNYHAEQLLAYYIFGLDHYYTLEHPLNIGVSKLCCRSCEAVFIDKAIKTRGNHGNSYVDVENVFAYEEVIKFKTPDHKNRPTKAFNSVPGTHKQSRLQWDNAGLPMRELFPALPLETKKYTKYFGETPQVKLGGLFASYLQQREDDYWFFDIMQSLFSKIVNSIANFFGSKASCYTSQKDARTSYVNELKELIVDLTKENIPLEDDDFTDLLPLEDIPLEDNVCNKLLPLEKAIKKGLTLFKPRQVDSPSSLENLLKGLAKYADVTVINTKVTPRC